MAEEDLSKLTPQQLREYIQEVGSKNKFLLLEMQRLGFWPKDEGQPIILNHLIERESELSKEIEKLLKVKKVFDNSKQVLKQIHKTRMANARLRREETKVKREKIRQEKVEKWKLIKEKDIAYLGESISKGLGEKLSNEEVLKRLGLPILHNAEDLSKAINTKIGNLRFLAFYRKVSQIHHYVRFLLPKKSGGTRVISAPMPRLKKVQYWILENILNKVRISKEAHGFCAKKSILTNAQPHVGKDIVINLDLKDFFPTITYVRTKGVFKKLGYSEQVSTILALICTEPEGDWVEIDNKKYFVNNGKRFLPQGAPTSPAITNIICRKLDRRLAGLASKYNFVYTRYADDFTFSASKDAAENLTKILWGVRQIIKGEGFNLHPDKTRIMRKGVRQEVTGIVVNEKLNINGRELKKFRALLFQIEKDGIVGKKWDGSTNILAAIKGYAGFVNMVNSKKGAPLVRKVNEILKKHNFKHTIKHHAKLPKEEPVEITSKVTTECAVQSNSKAEEKSILGNVFSWVKKTFFK